MITEQRLENLYRLAIQIQKTSLFWEENGQLEEYLQTAADLARSLGLKLDYVKKQLHYLRDLEIILPVGYNPKRYRFDFYHFRHLLTQPPEDEIVLQLLEYLNNQDN